MNYAQKKYVAIVFVALAPLACGVLNFRWVIENWSWLKWPSLVFVFLLAALGGKEATGWGEPNKNLVDFLQEHPLLKLWVAIYTLIIVVFITYGLTHGIEFHKSPGLWLLLGFGPLLLPLFVAGEYQRYKRLGTQSNPRSHGTASLTRRRQ